jgi:hypothetical protein
MSGGQEIWDGLVPGYITFEVRDRVQMDLLCMRTREKEGKRKRSPFATHTAAALCIVRKMLSYSDGSCHTGGEVYTKIEYLCRIYREEIKFVKKELVKVNYFLFTAPDLKMQFLFFISLFLLAGGTCMCCLHPS